VSIAQFRDLTRLPGLVLGLRLGTRRVIDANDHGDDGPAKGESRSLWSPPSRRTGEPFPEGIPIDLGSLPFSRNQWSARGR